MGGTRPSSRRWELTPFERKLAIGVYLVLLAVLIWLGFQGWLDNRFLTLIFVVAGTPLGAGLRKLLRKSRDEEETDPVMKRNF